MSDNEAVDAGGTAITCEEGEVGEEDTVSLSGAAMPDECRTADKRKADPATEDDDEDDTNNHEGKPELKKKFIMCPSLRNEEAKYMIKSEDELKQSQKSAPIKMSLNTQKKSEIKAPVIRKSAAVAKAFNPDEESDEEEMPPEAKMRMRNIGRDTPTAAGPNSYGKGRLGFCDRQKIFEREIKKKTDSPSN
ncbi:PEST proteolytic signal-containing nuclear protein isoform X1 [Octopus bimaculoides]|uniref:PEST proteolytic signal-containing nuclear protein n=1 Tax=Octopus bimaculoides TaxID=37653 RepID=A0A0L8FG75_OCTBM|nr:PEST proteolytic signal-containing nuclear protein isoform X1 [Octopus bimaculoides]|eukprot:XP_014790072.1 PREDICTED: PEST proteolytic signal-containing nuclear protein-like isoform X1 [Octopus bimaculoides]